MKNVLRIVKGERADPIDEERSRPRVLQSAPGATRVLINTPAVIVLGFINKNFMLEEGEVWT